MTDKTSKYPVLASATLGIPVVTAKLQEAWHTSLPTAVEWTVFAGAVLGGKVTTDWRIERGAASEVRVTWQNGARQVTLHFFSLIDDSDSWVEFTQTCGDAEPLRGDLRTTKEALPLLVWLYAESVEQDTHHAEI